MACFPSSLDQIATLGEYYDGLFFPRENAAIARIVQIRGFGIEHRTVFEDVALLKVGAARNSKPRVLVKTWCHGPLSLEDSFHVERRSDIDFPQRHFDASRSRWRWRIFERTIPIEDLVIEDRTR